jgi:hypothetical protein
VAAKVRRRCGDGVAEVWRRCGEGVAKVWRRCGEGVIETDTERDTETTTQSESEVRLEGVAAVTGAAKVWQGCGKAVARCSLRVRVWQGLRPRSLTHFCPLLHHRLHWMLLVWRVRVRGRETGGVI